MSDQVERNRTTPRRRVPGREELGHSTTVRLMLVTAAVLLAASAALVMVLVLAR